MSEPPKKSFRLASELPKGTRDQDNAKPVPPPPKGPHIDHPRLAPPGMAGVRPVSFRVVKPPPAPPIGKSPADQFKAIVLSPDKASTREH